MEGMKILENEVACIRFMLRSKLGHLRLSDNLNTANHKAEKLIELKT